jgi:UPF0716 protein FxsA
MGAIVLLLIFGALIGVTVLEFYVVIKVGEAIGVPATLGLMVIDALIGSALMRSQGRAAWRRLRAALAEGRPPAREVLDGALIVAGGAFLITPGFVTDVFGALLLIPPTRSLVRRWIVRHFSGRLLGATAGRWARRGGWPPGRGPGGRGPATPGPDFAARPPTQRPDYDVEGDAVDVDRGELRP